MTPPNHLALLSQQSTTKERGVVLVVDDEYVNRAIMCRLLKKAGFDTVEASNGIEALEAIDATEFDLILLDIVMPEMNGFEVLKTLRRKRSELDLPVIMVTANDEAAQVVEAFENGANDFINKPIDPAVTMARINMHLQFAKSRADLRKSEERYALVAQGTNDGLWDWDLQKNEIYFSPRWFAILACEETEHSTPAFWFQRIHQDDIVRVTDELKRHFTGATPLFETEMRMRHEDGSFRWTLCRGLAVFDENGVAQRIAGSLTDVTKAKVADALTGLPNRVLFRERLDHCVSRKKRQKDFNFSLLYLDLDNFKLVNDSMGHEAGDRLLVSIARRLESSLREAESIVCRLGGDEFGILIEGFNSRHIPTSIAERIIGSVGTPISIGCGREVYASVSIGISFAGDGLFSADEIVQAADTAMYRAKEHGKSCYRIFDPAMKRNATKRLNLENELRHAVENDQLTCYFQPIIETASRRISGFESLVRWTHERLGEVAPKEFIPIAEESELVERIGMIVLRKSCQQLADWRRADVRFKDLHVSVNLSSRQLKSHTLVDQVLGVIADTGVPPSSLKIEITESMIMENPERSARVLSALQREGVKIAIDDFGTGYSSLSCIHELSPDAVKIDRSFVDKITKSGDKETIVRAIIALADGLKLDVVAEGIETECQHQILQQMGCKYGQGFLYSHPLAPEELFNFVVNENHQRGFSPVLPVPESASGSVHTANNVNGQHSN